MSQLLMLVSGKYAVRLTNENSYKFPMMGREPAFEQVRSGVIFLLQVNGIKQ
jgi:hypothetical protein